MDARRERLIGLWLLGGFLLAMAIFALRQAAPPLDLAVYLRAGRMFSSGGGLYEPGWGSPLAYPLPYTYPPVLAAAFSALGWLPWRLASVVWTLVNALLLVWIVQVSFDTFLRRQGAPARLRTLSLLVIAAVIVTPIARDFWFGQVGIVLTAACLADTVRPRRRLPQGILIGAATAVKLVPGIFGLFWAITGRFRAALVAAGTAIGLWLLAAAVRPSLSWQFWTDVVFHNDRVGDPATISNQSLLGMLLRIGWTNRLVWLSMAIVVLGVGLYRARAAHLFGNELAAVTLVGITALLVSPVSWIHHGVWVVPAIGVTLGDGRSRGRQLAAVAVASLYLLRLPEWSDELSGSIKTLAENAYTIGYLILIALLPIRAAAVVEPVASDLATADQAPATNAS